MHDERHDQPTGDRRRRTLRAAGIGTAAAAVLVLGGIGVTAAMADGGGNAPTVTAPSGAPSGAPTGAPNGAPTPGVGGTDATGKDATGKDAKGKDAAGPGGSAAPVPGCVALPAPGGTAPKPPADGTAPKDAPAAPEQGDQATPAPTSGS